MRLFLKELPVQWQPIGFLTVIILFIVLVIIFSGFEISSPLLRIGVGQQARFELKQKENELLQVKAEKEKLENDMREYELNIKQLEKNKDLLKQRLLKTIEENHSTRQIGISKRRNYGSTAISDVSVRNTQTQDRERNIYIENRLIREIDNLQINESNVPAPQIGNLSRNLLLMNERNIRQPVEHDDIGEGDTHNTVNRQQSPVTSTEHSDNEHSTESEQNSESDPETIQASSMYEPGYVLVEGHGAQG